MIINAILCYGASVLIAVTTLFAVIYFFKKTVIRLTYVFRSTELYRYNNRNVSADDVRIFRKLYRIYVRTHANRSI